MDLADAFFNPDLVKENGIPPILKHLASDPSRGFCHRDIKPANLLLNLDGIVWVTDFGLAKADDSDDLSHTGDLLGTLRYMPPEAFEGKSDARGDVYALGITLFELAALRPAYEEHDRNKLVKRMATGAPRRDENPVAWGTCANC